MPLVFLHGLGGGSAAWTPQVDYFGARGHRCIAWNQPGYGGRPSVEPYALEKIVEALAGELDGPSVLVGHSMGGLVAQETYFRHPRLVKALALCFTSPGFPGGTSFAREFVAARLGPLDEGKTMPEVARKLMPAMRGSRSEPEGLALAERTMGAVPPDTYRKAVHMLTTFDRRAELPKIAVPTLLVAGSDDRTAPPRVMEKMAAAIPGARLVVLPGCGHLGPMDQPAAFNAALESFLEGL